MKSMAVSFVSLFFLAALCQSCAVARQTAPTFKVDDYGAFPNENTDSGPAIRNAIAAAVNFGFDAEVIFGPGRYRVLPAEGEERVFPIRDAKNLTIRGVGEKTEIVVGNPKVGCFIVENGENVLLKDFVIDYDPAPNTQGRIVRVNVEEAWFDLDIDPGFPLLSNPLFSSSGPHYKRWGLLFDHAERRQKTAAPNSYFISHFEHLGDRVWRLFLAEQDRWEAEFIEPGDRFVQLARHMSGNALFFFRCKNGGIENVTVHAAPALASGVVRSDDVRVRGLSVRFRPASPRLLTTNADGVHCAQNRKGPLIENSFFEGMADDSINIYCPAAIVRRVESPTSVITTAGCELAKGDLLQIINPRDGLIVDEVPLAGFETSSQHCRLIFDRPVPGITAGTDHTDSDTIYNLSASGEGYVIRNNHMRLHRRHGIMLAAGNGLVEGNRIEEVSGLGIVVKNSPNWPEGPFARNVVIRRNTIIAPGAAWNSSFQDVSGAIMIKAAKLENGVADQRAIRNIAIENNRIVDPIFPAIYSAGVEGIRIVDNWIEASADAPRTQKNGAVVLNNSSAVTIKNLKVIDPRSDTIAAIEILASVEAGVGKVRLDGLEAVLHKDSVEVGDNRSGLQ